MRAMFPDRINVNKAALGIVFAIVAVLRVLFGGGTRTGPTLSGEMMGNGAIGGINWMWITGLYCCLV